MLKKQQCFVNVFLKKLVLYMNTKIIQKLVLYLLSLCIMFLCIAFGLNELPSKTVFYIFKLRKPLLFILI